MSIINVILSRRSIRKYQRKDLSKEQLEKILECGRQSPSANNVQPWHFIVITDKNIKEALSLGRWNTFIKDSSLTIVGCAYTGNDYGRRWSTIDTTIALQNMVISAWALGIGSCWIGDFKEKEVKDMLNISEDWKVVALISFGYPNEKILSCRKKSISEIVSYNRFL
jgi:nitroreductase